MSLQFFNASKRAISRQGVDCTYVKVVSTYDASTGVNSTTSTTQVIKAYPKQEVATQYNYPDLVGKEIISFYIYELTPSLNDKIIYKGNTYTVSQIKEYVGGQLICFFKVIGVKS